MISAPGVRARKPEFIGFGASPDRGVDWKPEDAVTMRLRVYEFETPDIPGLLERFMSARKAVTGPNHPRNLIPFSEVTRLMASGLTAGFTTARSSSSTARRTPIGSPWLGWRFDRHVPNAGPRRPKHLERVTKTFDFAIPRAQGRSGYFLGP